MLIVVDEWNMIVEQWWNDTDWGGMKQSETALSQFRVVHNKSQMERPGIDSGISLEKPTTNLSHGMT